MQSSTQHRRMVRAKQAAVMFSIGESTLWLFAKQGKLNPIKVSARVTLWPVDQLESFFGSPQVATARVEVA